MPAREQNNFNILRLFLAALVALSHSSELLDGNRSREILFRLTGQASFGDIAVSSFFVISGFLVAQSWQRKPDFWKFMEKRARRLYPAFIVASLISAFIVGPFSGPEYMALFDYSGYVWSLLFLKVPYVPPVFAQTQPYSSVNGSLWSISHEAKCYWGLAIFGVLSLYVRRFWIALFLSAWVAAWIGMHYGLFPAELLKQVGELPFYNRFFFRSAAYFIAGVAYWRFHKKIKLHPAGALLAVAILLLTGVYGGFILAWLLCGSYLLFYFAFANIKSIRFFRSWPDMSYGTYLYSWPLFKLLIAAKPDFTPWLLFFTNLLLSVACGYLSWTFIEKRFLLRS